MLTDEESRRLQAEHADFRVAILNLQESDKNINRALYGDEKNGELGMVAENHMMFEFFSGAMWLVRSAKWIVGVIAFVGTVVGTIWHFFRPK
jgi:hypothetical protein